jgi:hypothetical protein
LVGWLLLSLLAVYPHQLSYFNLLAGGANGGWRYLADSNVDWGQDLHRLPGWMAENGVERVWLSYFGESRPGYYAIAYDGLDSFPPRLMNPNARPFSPYNPAPGVYAISATNLQGVLFANHDQFAWFRDRKPIGKLGYSIFLYEVEPEGEPVAVALSGVQVDELEPTAVNQFLSNQLVPRWFDAGQALLLPDAEWSWLGLGNETAVSPQLTDYLADRQATAVRGASYALFPINPRSLLPRWAIGEMGVLGQENGRLSLRGAEIRTPTLAPGSVLDLSTAWLNQSGPQPVKLFVHLVDGNEQLVAQWDGLGAAWEGWRSGDTLLQSHQIWLAPEVAAGSYTLWVGAYHPASFARWQTAAGQDRILVGTVTIE